MLNRAIFVCWLLLTLYFRDSFSLTLPPFASTTTLSSATPALLQTSDVVTKVAVAGATGRTGRLVVQELIDRGVQNVVALVRDPEKAKALFNDDCVEIVKCDLGDEKQLEKALKGVDAAIWCATGFSNAPVADPFQKMMRLLGMALQPKKSIDAVALPAIARCLAKTGQSNGLPKLVMCSSAGVTRPVWDATKKEQFPGAADIPIVRLNPFGILDVKRESEQKLRETGVEYCIVRPAGLNDNWPSGSRPVFAQGDVTVGRINRKDLAALLVDCLSTAEATGKTFETITLAGYPRATSISAALSRLQLDSEGLPPDEVIATTYAAMQQLLPGEKQDSAGLAMGQTYEELDKGKIGRLGKRGEENLQSVTLKPSS